MAYTMYTNENLMTLLCISSFVTRKLLTKYLQTSCHDRVPEYLLYREIFHTFFHVKSELKHY